MAKHRDAAGLPKSREEAPAGTGSSLAAVFSTTGGWVRLCLTLVLLAMLACGIAYILVALNIGVTIGTDKLELQSTPGAIGIKYGPTSIAILSVPATQIWVQSGVIVRPGETWSLSASGQVHLGLQHLVECGVMDAPPRTAWVGPTGESILGQPKQRSHLQHSRDKLLLYQEGGKYGQLLIALAPEGTEIDPNTRPTKAIAIRAYEPDTTGAMHLKTPPGHAAYQLLFAVNDQFIDPDDRHEAAFVGTPAAHLDDVKVRRSAGRLNYREIAIVLEHMVRTHADAWQSFVSSNADTATLFTNENGSYWLAATAHRQLEQLPPEVLAQVMHWTAQMQYSLSDKHARSRLYYDDNAGNFIVRMTNAQSE